MARNTVQQAIIERALHELGNHPTADEVFCYVSKDHPTIGKATVYRTLNKLASSGKALKVRMPNGADRFDHTVTPHYHVCCSQCGKLDDVIIPIPQEISQDASKISGYKIDSFTLHFWGLCPDCLRKEEEKCQ